MAEKSVDNVLYHLIFNRIQNFYFSDKIFDFCRKAAATIKKPRPLKSQIGPTKRHRA